MFPVLRVGVSLDQLVNFRDNFELTYQWRFPFVSRTFELTASFSSLQHTDRVSNKTYLVLQPIQLCTPYINQNSPSKHRNIPPLFETALVLPQSCQKAKLVTRPGTCICQLCTRKSSVDANTRREMRWLVYLMHNMIDRLLQSAGLVLSGVSRLSNLESVRLLLGCV